jgi:hypothetical protein
MIDYGKICGNAVWPTPADSRGHAQHKKQRKCTGALPWLKEKRLDST